MTKMADFVTSNDLSLTEVQNEPWLLRALDKVSTTKVFDVDNTLNEELLAISAELTEAYHHGKPRFTIIRTHLDLESMQEKEARYLALHARITEIFISLLPIKRRIEDLWDGSEEKLNRYRAVSDLGNERKRTLFYAAALAPLKEKRNKIEDLIETCQRIEEHLKQVHFSIKEISAMGIEYLKHKGP